MLQPHFAHVEKRIYEDHLHVTQVEPLLAYIASRWDVVDLVDEDLVERIARQVQEEILHSGYFLIEKSQGIILGQKAL